MFLPAADLHVCTASCLHGGSQSFFPVASHGLPWSFSSREHSCLLVFRMKEKRDGDTSLSGNFQRNLLIPHSLPFSRLEFSGWLPPATKKGGIYILFSLMCLIYILFSLMCLMPNQHRQLHFYRV